MKSSDPPAPAPSDQPPEFPVAEARDNEGALGLLLHSRMWWVTLGCLIIAAVLVWMSIPRVGPRITIRFPEGHGLKPGDVMRHRGIEVGVVTAIGLSHNLNAIDVQVTLQPEASALARQGSRFWIVRPQLSLQGVTGLETAVGSKYIGVSPGEVNESYQAVFEGLAAAPPDQFVHDGVEIVLRSDARHGLNAGAPVTWRGVDAGQVLSVGLSPDAMHVDIHIRIDARFRRLVNTNSKFWVTSGLGVDFRLTGVRLTAESLATIARGGLSFITPSPEDPETPVSTVVAGRVFTLHSEFQSKWLESAVPIALFDINLPQTVSLSGQRNQPILGISRDTDFTSNGILLATSQGPTLITASDTFETLESEQLRTVTIREPGVDEQYELSEIPASGLRLSSTGVAALPLSDVAWPGRSLASAGIRVPTVPEECVVARSVGGEEGATSVMYSIGAERFVEQDSVWTFTEEEMDLTEWHGAPVVAVSDGQVIGVLLMTDGSPAVAPCTGSIAGNGP